MTRYFPIKITASASLLFKKQGMKASLAPTQVKSRSFKKLYEFVRRRELKYEAPSRTRAEYLGKIPNGSSATSPAGVGAGRELLRVTPGSHLLLLTS